VTSIVQGGTSISTTYPRIPQGRHFRPTELERYFLQPIFSSGEVIQTAAEKAREKRLRDDPMAQVLGPLFVCCKRCGSRIKLSPKSTYDPFHWQKHRERCLKKPASVVKQKKRDAEELVRKFDGVLTIGILFPLAPTVICSSMPQREHQIHPVRQVLAPSHPH
jgi:hypothetical protein